MRQRVLKYFVPVTFLSFVFTIPKFFESQVEYADEGFFEDAHVYEDNITSVHSGIFFLPFNYIKQERKGFCSMIASSQFSNLAIWQLGNLATWQYGNLAT